MPRIATIDERYQSYNVEMLEVTGGKFWKPYGPELNALLKQPAPGAASSSSGDTPAGMNPGLYQYRPPIDLSNARLRKLAAALGPAYVRVSGTWANSTYFPDTDTAPAEPPAGFIGVLKRDQWKGVVDFSRAVDAGIVTSFATSVGARDNTGVWAPEQAKRFLDYTRSVGGQIAAAEFMNEPTFAAMGSKLLFVLGFGIILSMYGGGFATVPAYLADMFGTQFVGAIHGRLLTAWSTAGIIGPVVVNYIREFQLAAGVPRDQLYNTTMYILCAMLIAGLICNYLIKPVDKKWHMSEAEVAKLQAATASAGASGPSGSYGIGFGGLDVKAALFGAFVGIPLAWGVWKTLESAVKIL